MEAAGLLDGLLIFLTISLFVKITFAAHKQRKNVLINTGSWSHARKLKTALVLVNNKQTNFADKAFCIWSWCPASNRVPTFLAATTRRHFFFLPSQIELWKIPFLKPHACTSSSRNPSIQRRAKTRILQLLVHSCSLQMFPMPLSCFWLYIQNTDWCCLPGEVGGIM